MHGCYWRNSPLTAVSETVFQPSEIKRKPAADRGDRVKLIWFLFVVWLQTDIPNTVTNKYY